MVYQRVSKPSFGNSRIYKKDSASTAPAIPIQAKSDSASPQEQEMPNHTPLAANWVTNNNLMKNLSSGAGVVQRQEESGEEEMEPIQAKPATGEEDWQLPTSSGGKPMPKVVQQKMEMAFGTDFSDVRIHEGSNAQSIGAVAYTQGSDIHFAPGKHDPTSQSGQELLGHELAHVVQQKLGRVSAPQGKGVPINAEPQLEHEADVLGAKAAQGESVNVAGASASCQRKEIQAANKPVQCMFDSSSNDWENILDQPIPADLNLDQPLSPESFVEPINEEMNTTFLHNKKMEREAELASMGGGASRTKDTAKGVMTKEGLHHIPKAKPTGGIEEKKTQGRQMDQRYANEQEEGKAKYFKGEEKASHEAKVNEEGLLTTANLEGEQVPINTQTAQEREIQIRGSKGNRFIFARDHKTKKLYVADEGVETREAQSHGEGERVPHAGLVEGENVQAAGEIETTTSGRIKTISDKSGHYKPEAEDTYEFVKDLATSKEEGGLGAKLVDDSKDEFGHAKNTPARVELGEKNNNDLEIGLTYQQFLQTGGNEAQIRNKAFLSQEIIRHINDKKGGNFKPSQIAEVVEKERRKEEEKRRKAEETKRKAEEARKIKEEKERENARRNEERERLQKEIANRRQEAWKKKQEEMKSKNT